MAALRAAMNSGLVVSVGRGISSVKALKNVESVIDLVNEVRSAARIRRSRPVRFVQPRGKERFSARMKCSGQWAVGSTTKEGFYHGGTRSCTEEMQVNRRTRSTRRGGTNETQGEERFCPQMKHRITRMKRRRQWAGGSGQWAVGSGPHNKGRILSRRKCSSTEGR